MLKVKLQGTQPASEILSFKTPVIEFMDMEMPVQRGSSYKQKAELENHGLIRRG
jgi:hypothetical protein